MTASQEPVQRLRLRRDCSAGVRVADGSRKPLGSVLMAFGGADTTFCEGCAMVFNSEGMTWGLKKGVAGSWRGLGGMGIKGKGARRDRPAARASTSNAADDDISITPTTSRGDADTRTGPSNGAIGPPANGPQERPPGTTEFNRFSPGSSTPAALTLPTASLNSGLKQYSEEKTAKQAENVNMGSNNITTSIPGAVLRRSQQRQKDAKEVGRSTDAITKPAPTTTETRGLRRSVEERAAKAAARGSAGNATSGVSAIVPPGAKTNPETIPSKNATAVAPIQHGVYHVPASATSSATTGDRSSVSSPRGLGKNRKNPPPFRESTDVTITKCGALVPPQRNSSHDNITTGTQENDTPQEFSHDPNQPANATSNRQALIEDLVGGIAPIPTAHQGASNNQPSQPGAYMGENMRRVSELDFRLVGTDASSDNQNSVENDLEVVLPPTPDTLQIQNATSDQGLVEARAITESSMFICQEAQQVDDALLEHQFDREKKERHCRRVGYAIIFCATIIIAISLGVGLRPKPAVIIDATSTAPTTAPSMDPTSLESFLLSLLPDHTIKAIEDIDSAQYKAFDWLLKDHSVYEYPEWRIIQRHALMTVFYATAGPTKWFNNTGWETYNLHECDWFQDQEFALKTFLQTIYHGVLEGFLEPLPHSQCNDQGNYKHLWLDMNNLEGSLPEELFSLTSLETFSAGFNKLHGTISSYIGQLRSLQGIGIFNTGLSGSLPTELGYLSSLQVLGLFSNQLEGFIPEELWQLAKLDTLGLGRNKVQGTIPSGIGTLPMLRWLVMNDSDLSGSLPTEVGQATSLEYLVLAPSNLSGTLPSELGSLSRLWVLTAGGLKGTVPTELGLLDSLYIFDSKKGSLTGTLPSELSLLSSIWSLELDNNQLSGTIPSELLSLSNLESFSLASNHLTGEIASEFGLMTRLGWLSVADNNLRGTVPTELAALHASLYGFRIDGNPQLSGVIPDSLCAVNGTCVGTGFDSCSRGNYGSWFNCTELLCGCDCPCKQQ
ncbi:LRR receptor-like serine threonine-protein kinase [Seminavis robusta]|uniref:LRR receptor-like serine threonine-protein kinase n=1 Tax=Seminavis robusta TaxID=568900 RepID=A0A9N8DTE5_9STRA|nr:LRR receptor-like serine threonine-protein kinase [Seminavis robusta]|eukprot:Sro343_g122010.1 LRR receptor-like serine threonine-protein kinase (1008) ;mRNA; r:40114-43427